MPPLSLKFAFVGAGNIAKAIVGGLITKRLVPSSDIFVFDTDCSKYECDIMRSVKCCDTLKSAVEAADVVCFALKPTVIATAIDSIKSEVSAFSDKIYLSVAAAVSSEYICSKFGVDVPVIRTMPNTPLLLGEGAVAISRNAMVNDRIFSTVCRLFSSIAEISVIDEAMMNPIISVNGSSPAYLYLFFKGMLEGAVSQGVPADKAMPLILQSIRGACCMIERSGKDVDTLISDVSSPNGTTLAALSVFNERDLVGTIVDAMDACTKRANEMERELSN